MLHNGSVYVRPLKHFAARRLRQTIRSAQTGHQLLLGTARELSPASTRFKTVFSLLLALILSASLLRASPLVMVNQLPAVGSHVTNLTSLGVAFSKAAFGVDAFALLVRFVIPSGMGRRGDSGARPVKEDQTGTDLYHETTHFH
jgi:hypothetical protein